MTYTERDFKIDTMRPGEDYLRSGRGSAVEGDTYTPSSHYSTEQRRAAALCIEDALQPEVSKLDEGQQVQEKEK